MKRLLEVNIFVKNGFIFSGLLIEYIGRDIVILFEYSNKTPQ